MAARRRKDAKPAEQAAKPASDAPDDLIDMPEAVKLLKTTRTTFYRWLRAGKIKGMKLGRQWRFYRQDIERFLKGQAPRVDLPADMTPLIRTLRQRLSASGHPTPAMPGQNQVQQAVGLMILAGLFSRASDIHLHPHLGQDSDRPVALLRYRIDGVMHAGAEIDIRLLPALAAEWKRMAACDADLTDKPQDGRILMRVPDLDPDRVLDIRVCFLPAALGPAVTARLLEPAPCLKLDELHYAPADRERLRTALGLPWGLVVVAGPTGSGKTTTLYACVNELAGPATKVMSLECPVEYFLPWVTQVEVNPRTGLTFSAGLRSILRSDPDVILCGEIRDRESLAVCIQAALTGHLVLTTLHTDEAAAVFKRMTDIGSDPFLVADSVKLVLAQRLVRRLCPHCSQEGAPTDDAIEAAAAAARQGGLGWDALPRTFRKAAGCARCGQTGFRGRMVVAETIGVTPEIARAIRAGAAIEEVRAAAVAQGTTTLAADAVRRAAAGETSLDEIRRVLH